MWLGDIDDLWKMGRPHGHGGPWTKTPVQPDTPSDPFLMAGYASKSVRLSHDSAKTVKFTLEVDFLADGTWHDFKTFDVPTAQVVQYAFPSGYSAQWVRTNPTPPARRRYYSNTIDRVPRRISPSRMRKP